MRLYPILETFARGPKRGPARAPAKEPFPFQELLPLKLKDSVSGKGEKSSDVACLQEMSILFACFKKNEFNQVLCTQEIQNFSNCFSNYEQKKKVKKEQTQKGILVPGSKNLSHRQVNQLLKKVPNS